MVSICVTRDEIQITVVSGVTIDSHSRAKAAKPVDDDAVRQQKFNDAFRRVANEDAQVTTEGRALERAQERLQLLGGQVPPGAHDQIRHSRRLAPRVANN